jgi:hypothetical protein
MPSVDSIPRMRNHLIVIQYYFYYVRVICFTRDVQKYLCVCFGDYYLSEVNKTRNKNVNIILEFYRCSEYESRSEKRQTKPIETVILVYLHCLLGAGIAESIKEWPRVGRLEFNSEGQVFSSRHHVLSGSGAHSSACY